MAPIQIQKIASYQYEYDTSKSVNITLHHHSGVFGLSFVPPASV